MRLRWSWKPVALKLTEGAGGVSWKAARDLKARELLVEGEDYGI